MLNAFKKKSTEVAIAVEYVAPHWVILIQNPGQKDWTALRSPTKQVRIPNEFGDVVKSYPAIETFPNKVAAEAWASEHLSGAERLARKNSEIEKFLLKAKSPVHHFA